MDGVSCMHVLAFRFLAAGAFVLALALNPAPASAQSNSDHALFIEGAPGLYTPIGTSDVGPAVYINGGRRLPAGFVGALTFGLSHVSQDVKGSNAGFNGESLRSTHSVYRASLRYPLRAGNHQIAPVAGLAVLQSHRPVPTRITEGGTSQTVIDDNAATRAGIHLALRYAYKLNTLQTGIRADAHIVPGTGTSVLLGGPFLAVSF